MNVSPAETWKSGYVSRLLAHTQGVKGEKLTTIIRCGHRERSQHRMGKYSGTSNNGKT